MSLSVIASIYENVLGSVLQSVLRGFWKWLQIVLRMSRKGIWECTVIQVRSVPSSVLRRILQQMLGSVFENIGGCTLRVDSVV
jgi:hypothetical protein